MVWLCEVAHFRSEGSAGTEGYSLKKISYRGRLNRIIIQDVVNTPTKRRGLRWIHPRSFRTFCRINGGCGFIVSCSQAVNRNRTSLTWSSNESEVVVIVIMINKTLPHKIRCHIKAAAWWVARYSVSERAQFSSNQQKKKKLLNTNIAMQYSPSQHYQHYPLLSPFK
jgi:hypothetical protein